ncbi:MAG: hypothetical protein HC767_00915 [Akkermansiaceae bacterium]|nr:hypothetical protein [Akkermansiaceae bacterium]
MLDVQMISRLHKAAMDLLPQQDSQSLSLTLVAFNKLQSRPIQLVEALPQLSDAQILSFEPLHIANLLFALASLHFSPEAHFLRNMVTAAELQAELFKLEEWENLTWALAKFSQGKSPSLRCASTSMLRVPHVPVECSCHACSGSNYPQIVWHEQPSPAIF